LEFWWDVERTDPTTGREEDMSESESEVVMGKLTCVPDGKKLKV
jgi:hypothetical protein